MTLFLSTTINKMDSKCRVSVPSNFRSSLQKQSFKGLIAFPSYKSPNIDACGIDRMERISDDLDNNNEYSQEEFDLVSLYFGEACLLYTSPSPRDATLSRMPSSA